MFHKSLTHHAFSKKSFALLFKRSAFDLTITVTITVTVTVITLIIVTITVIRFLLIQVFKIFHFHMVTTVVRRLRRRQQWCRWRRWWWQRWQWRQWWWWRLPDQLELLPGQHWLLFSTLLLVSLQGKNLDDDYENHHHHDHHHDRHHHDNSHDYLIPTWWFLCARRWRGWDWHEQPTRKIFIVIVIPIKVLVIVLLIERMPNLSSLLSLPSLEVERPPRSRSNSAALINNLKSGSDVNIIGINKKTMAKEGSSVGIRII